MCNLIRKVFHQNSGLQKNPSARECTLFILLLGTSSPVKTKSIPAPAVGPSTSRCPVPLVSWFRLPNSQCWSSVRSHHLSKLMAPNPASSSDSSSTTKPLIQQWQPSLTSMKWPRNEAHSSTRHPPGFFPLAIKFPNSVICRNSYYILQSHPLSVNSLHLLELQHHDDNPRTSSPELILILEPQSNFEIVCALVDPCRFCTLLETCWFWTKTGYYQPKLRSHSPAHDPWADPPPNRPPAVW